MKTMMKTLLALTASAVLWAGQANAVLIEIVPSTVGPVAAGENVAVEIWATDLGGDYISAYDILVAYDTSLLSWSSVGFAGCELGECVGAALTDLAVGSDLTDAAGLIGWSQLSLLFDWEFPDFQDGSDFRLFSINFVADVGFDTTMFDFVWDEFHDVKCAENEVCFPTSVPEPGTMSLLGLGLLALGLIRRRRKLL